MSDRINNIEVNLVSGAWLLDLPQIDYGPALELQHTCVAARKTGSLERDLIMLLEHPPVFTLGRRGGLDNLLISEDQLKQKGIDIVPIERGGNITYHGPGQLVAYLIIDLRAAGLSITDLVTGLESAMAATAGHWGIQAQGNNAFRGAWVNTRKLGSIGLTVRRGITFHGLALNVNTDLTPFEWINPCGIEGCRMTSLAAEAGRPLEMDAVKKQLTRQLAKLLGRPLTAIDMQDLHSKI